MNYASPQHHPPFPSSLVSDDPRLGTMPSMSLETAPGESDFRLNGGTFTINENSNHHYSPPSKPSKKELSQEITRHVLILQLLQRMWFTPHHTQSRAQAPRAASSCLRSFWPILAITTGGSCPESHHGGQNVYGPSIHIELMWGSSGSN